MENKLIAHGDISMNRFCSEDVELITDDSNQVISETNLSELKFWHHGMLVGTWTGSYILKTMPFLR